MENFLASFEADLETILHLINLSNENGLFFFIVNKIILKKKKILQLNGLFLKVKFKI